MVARAFTVAFEGVEARLVEVQCAVSPGLPGFAVVGLPDKAVSEARERVRAALSAMSIALPSKRITVNLSPADLPKEGSHFDLPIALALLAALEILPKDAVAATVALGELSLDGTLIPVIGALPAALAAAEAECVLLCPHACGPEAAWVGAAKVLGARTLDEVIRHYTGQSLLTPAEAGEVTGGPTGRDLRDVKGQERAKRALEIAAAGRHHALLVGSPGSGKSMLAALEILPKDAVAATVALGELSLDGTLIPVIGALPAALAAAEAECVLLCPHACGPEAAWVGAAKVLGARTLDEVIRHYTGQSLLTPAEAGEVTGGPTGRDLRDVKGQERAKRALEIAAAGRHHALLVGSPGSGKSMLAARLPGILPPLTAVEALETSMIHSLAGLLGEGGISRVRPFREPHHTASMAAIVGGGKGAKPGEISLAHNGVLFMDEFPEFPRAVLETLRQPIETGDVVVARANAHVRYPCRFLLIAAANPCKCGYLADPARACARVPLCGEDYLGRISGPLMDRFDLRIEVPPVAYTDLDLPASGDASPTVAARVAAARGRQDARYAGIDGVRVNADAEGALLEEVASPGAEGRALLARVADRFGLSARGYHRILRVARTIADLEGVAEVRTAHVAEAVSYRTSLGAKG